MEPLTLHHSLKGGRHLDFTDPVSVMQLTKTLLNMDFGLQIELPEDRLCPPVSNNPNATIL
jgi:23S rRNA (adenine1618-N6)-methyltransferase